MDLKLVRNEFRSDGIFGTLYDQNGHFFCVTLEHAYTTSVDSESFAPKIPAGTYTCVRGMHRLEHMDHDFETFEITNVPGHNDILFHVGNYNRDSSGCVLLGGIINDLSLDHSITSSKDTFDKFMQLQNGVNSFNLVVA